MNTPDTTSTGVINELWDKHATPVVTTRHRDLEIDLTKYPDLRPDYRNTPAGWMCFDDARYDGPGSLVGWGESKVAALQDLIEQMEAESVK
jgi:hypothetical protein